MTERRLRTGPDRPPPDRPPGRCRDSRRPPAPPRPSEPPRRPVTPDRAEPPPGTGQPPSGTGHPPSGTGHPQPARRAPRAGPARAPRAGPARGSVTAEFAVALPALVLVLAVCLTALAFVATSLRCADAARAAARAAARGESAGAVVATARRTAGRPVGVTTSRTGDLLTVRVTATARAPFPLVRRFLPAVTLARDATARAEPGSGPDGGVP